MFTGVFSDWLRRTYFHGGISIRARIFCSAGAYLPCKRRLLVLHKLNENRRLLALHKLNEKFEHGNIGLYRDDELAVFENLSGRAADKARKEFTRIFGDLGLKITIQSNVKVADFLDVTLNLSNGKYYPFSKPNNEPVYINAKSNHPPTIIKHLPAAINRRISNLSCNEEEFHKASGPYNAALRASGYTTNLRYEQQGGKSNSNKKKK